MRPTRNHWRWPAALAAIALAAGTFALGAPAVPAPSHAQGATTIRIDGPLPATGPGGLIRHTLTLTNSGDAAVEIALSVEGGAWQAQAPAAQQVGPGEGAELTVGVAVPLDAADGEVDEATLRITADGALVAERTLGSWTGGRVVEGQWKGCRLDLDEDGAIDEADTALVVAGFGARAGAARYDGALDLDGDGRIGAGDVQAVAGAGGQTCAAPVTTESSAARFALDESMLNTYLEGLQAIADANDGHRAVGSSGYDASADFVAAELERLGWQVTRQRNNFPRVGISDAAFEVPGFELTRGEDFEAFGGSPEGDVTAALVAVDVTVPPANATIDSGCEAEDFAGFPAGAIALVQRGGCTFRTKIDNAAAAGAAAIVVFNQGNGNRTGLFNGGIGSGAAIPAIRLTYTAAEPVVERLTGGEEIQARVMVEITSEDRFGDNIIAEWPYGDPDRVIMAGGHLDSVPAGAGLNDNATGSSSLLALAQVIAGQELRPLHRIRLAWWAAEEIGLLGSARYVSLLPPEERAKLMAYLNFDMVGSPNFIRAIYDGDGSDASRSEPFGSGTLEWAFKEHFDAHDLAHEQIGDVIYRRSDHASFSEAGIPVGGLFSGFNSPLTAEQAQKYGGQEGASADPCYHQSCDSIDNVNVEGLEIMADAIAHTVLHFANDATFPLASGRAYPEQRPGAGSLDVAAAEAELRRALSALSAEGGCAAAHAAHAAELAGHDLADHDDSESQVHEHLPVR